MTNECEAQSGRALTRRALLIATVAAPLWLRSTISRPAAQMAHGREGAAAKGGSWPMTHGSMTDDERRQVVSLLEASGATLQSAVAGLTEAQWTFRPSPPRWTIAEIVDHLSRSEHAVLQLVTQVLVRQKVVEPAGRSSTDDAALVAMVRDRGRRGQAIDRVRPDPPSVPGRRLIDRFGTLRADTIAYLRRTTDDLRGRLADHPVAGAIDAYQWFLFLGAHTDRHVAQLREVAADSMFPPGD